MPTFTIITIPPSEWMARIHNRMPAILQDDAVDTWLNPGISDPESLTYLLKTAAEHFLECHLVEKSLLNSGLTDTPKCADNAVWIMRCCCAKECDCRLRTWSRGSVRHK